MKGQKAILLMVGFILMFALALSFAQPVKAAQKDDSITKPLTYQKPLDISLGKGGVYFPSSNYTGRAVLTRLEPKNTKKLTFTHRWLDIRLFDPNGKEIKTVYGFVYVYFNLNADDLAAWNKGKLGIYYYNITKDTWDECATRLIASKNSPYGRVSCLILDEFGRYGIAIKQ